MKLEGITINFLGDSITEGTGASGPEAIYHAVLTRNAGLKEARNYGISGTRFSYQQDPDGLDQNAFNRRFMNMDDDADAVVVFGGTNDYGHGTAPIGTFADRTPETFYGACHHLFRGLIQKYLGKPIVIMTPLHRCNETDTPIEYQGVLCKRSLKEYVDIIREVAEFYALPVLDLFAISGIQPDIPEIKEKYIPDGLHPNDEGNAVIAHLLQRFLENL